MSDPAIGVENLWKSYLCLLISGQTADTGPDWL
jgi:hypothetical protein